MRLQVLAIVTTLAVWTAASFAQQPAAPAPGQEQTPAFRTGVELMNLSITVTDKRGRTVTDLTRDDFAVLEDKQPQQIVSFSSAKQVTPTPIGLGLVLDASQSMTSDRLQSMRTAVELLFNRRLRKDDEVYFVEFASDARLTKAWTTDKKSVIEAIRRIRTRAGTALYNAILNSLQVSRAGQAKKQVMLVITDGSDSHSTVKRQDVALAARASDVIIYALVVDNEEGFGPGGRSNFSVRQAALELAEVTDATGGRTHYVQGFAQMEDAIEDLGKEFTQQYEVAYERPAADGRFHEITVSVKRPDVSVRHRRVYLASKN
jgi:Ca-activated chloride channel family protein